MQQAELLHRGVGRGRRGMTQEDTFMVGVEAIQPGMVLAEAACDPQGRMLIPNGTQLTQRHQRQMRLWGVELVTVLATGERAVPTALPTEQGSTRISEWLQLDEREP